MKSIMNNSKKMNSMVNIQSKSYSLNCSWFLPTENKNAKEIFGKEKIPFSKFFDVDEISDKTISLPHMFPNNETFIKHMREMDVRKNDLIICYDRLGIFSSARVWYTFKLFGAENVAVLNGGFVKWQNENLPIAKSPYAENVQRDEINQDDFDYKIDSSKVRDLNSTLDLSIKIVKKNTNEQLIDARPYQRYLGNVEEPRPSRIKGHIPGAKSVFFKDLIDENHCMKSTDQLKQEFEKQGINLDNEITLYCGSGVTASVDLLALTILGKYDQCKLYDGSWSEYGNIPEDHPKYLELINIKI